MQVRAAGRCSPGGVSGAGQYLVVVQETTAGQVTWRGTAAASDEDNPPRPVDYSQVSAYCRALPKPSRRLFGGYGILIHC